MSGTVAWLIVSLGLGVVIVRRRSVAVGLVTAQALVLAGYALADRSSGGSVAAAVVLGLRAAVLAGAVFFVIRRTRESTPVRAGLSPLTRAAIAVVAGLLLTWVVPDVGLGSRDAERAVLALVGFGLVVVATRRATLFHVLGIVTVDNAVALAGLSQRAGSPLLVDVGIAVDLLLVAGVATVFHERIFAEFGAGDSRALRSLRD